MITTVLLDAGGVILDEATHEQKHARIITELIAEQISTYTIDDYWRDVANAIKSFVPNVYHYILWKHLQPNRSAFNIAVNQHVQTWRDKKPPLLLMPGLRGELRQISKSFAIGIAGQYGAELLELLKREQLLDLFSHQVTQDDFAITKPDPRYYAQICERIDVNPCSCLMVGDRIDKDIVPAKQLGMKTIRIRHGLHRDQEPRTPDEFPDIELKSLGGLSEAVSELSQ
jgi:FMN phosphatase YigB (HAD superfamily)